VGSTEYPPVDSNPGTDEDNWLEIWNNVFMQFYSSRRVIITDAGSCLYDDKGKISDYALLADLESWTKA
jgi:alanyl-tRNA synthetase